MDSWKQKAAFARERLREARRGEKDLALLQLAGGKDPNTLRRTIFALDYLDDLAKSAPRLRSDLESVPLSLIELLARWRSFDPKGASKAAREVAKGRHSVSSLSKAMADTKKNGSDDFEPSYREQAAIDVIRKAMGDDIAFDEAATLSAPVDFQFIRAVGKPRRVEKLAAVMIGPYADPKTYSKRRVEWVQRCLGLAWMYHHVVMLVPHLPEVESYRSWLSESLSSIEKIDRGKLHPICLPSVHVLYAYPPLSAADGEALAASLDQ
jgi:hypothetical protein